MPGAPGTASTSPVPGSEVGQSLVLASPDTKILKVMQDMVAHRIHRVYIAESGQQPVGVITCTDLLKMFEQLMHA